MPYEDYLFLTLLFATAFLVHTLVTHATVPPTPAAPTALPYRTGRTPPIGLKRDWQNQPRHTYRQGYIQARPGAGVFATPR
jgi:hypothetical protein